MIDSCEILDSNKIFCISKKISLRFCNMNYVETLISFFFFQQFLKLKIDVSYIYCERIRGYRSRCSDARRNSSGNLSEMGHYELKALSSSTGQRCLEEGLARKRGPR